MTAVVDTSVIVAFYNKDDGQHARARQLVESAENGEFGRLLLPEHVFDEAVTLVLSRKGKHAALQLGQWLLGSSLELVYSDERLSKRAWEFFQKTSQLSFTDCFIACLAEERKAVVMSFDSGFQAVAGIKTIQ